MCENAPAIDTFGSNECFIIVFLQQQNNVESICWKVKSKKAFDQLRQNSGLSVGVELRQCIKVKRHFQE